MKIFKLALLGAGLLTSCAVAAKDYPHAKQLARADHFYGLYHKPSHGFVQSTADPPDFSRGRDDFGAAIPLYLTVPPILVDGGP
jgi:hypothetical protein